MAVGASAHANITVTATTPIHVIAVRLVRIDDFERLFVLM